MPIDPHLHIFYVASGHQRSSVMQETAYIIKQDGMPLRRTIRSMILSQGLPIVASKCLRLPMRAFETLYPRLDHLGVPLEVWIFNTVFNTKGYCEIGILRAHNARDRFLRLAGHHSDPAVCQMGTIRREFGAS